MEASEVQLDAVLETRKQRVKSSHLLETASSDSDVSMLKTKSLLISKKEDENALQKMEKYETICAIKLDKIQRNLSVKQQQTQNINLEEKEDIIINNKQLKVAEKTAKQLNKIEPTPNSTDNGLAAQHEESNDDSEGPEHELNTPITSKSNVVILSNEIVHSEEDCKQKFENMEKQLKELNKIAEKYKKLRKENDKVENKYAALKTKFHESEKQTKEYVELNKLLQKQLLEKREEEKAYNKKIMA